MAFRSCRNIVTIAFIHNFETRGRTLSLIFFFYLLTYHHENLIDNAVMSPIPLNTSRFYRFHYNMTTKFSFRLIISAKRMKFTALIILLALKIPAHAVINTKSGHYNEFTCVDHFPRR